MGLDIKLEQVTIKLQVTFCPEYVEAGANGLKSGPNALDVKFCTYVKAYDST